MGTLMLQAQTFTGETLQKIFDNPEVSADWQKFCRDEPVREHISYAEWCGIEPCRWDRELVWC